MPTLKTARAVRRQPPPAREPEPLALDPAVRRVLQLQRGAGNRAVVAMLAREPLTVRDVDYRPGTDELIDSTVNSAQFVSKILASSLNGVLNAGERTKLNQIGKQKLKGPQAAALATAVITYLAGNKQDRIKAMTPHHETVVEIIGTLATTGAGEHDKKAFRKVKGMATSMSRIKGTTNVVPWANLSPALRNNLAGIAAALLNQNNAIHNVANYAANDATTGVMGRATHGLNGVRSAHHNMAGWLPTHSIADMEPGLDTGARAWLAHIGPAAHPFAAPAAATSIDVESSGIAGLNNYFTGTPPAFNQGFAQTLPARAQRVQLAWSRYSRDFRAGCPYIEFTASGADGVSRFVWDCVHDRFYANAHYNWVDGFNPFFLITGTPAT